MTYYIEDNKIKLVRYIVSYTETKEWNNGNRITDTTQYLSTSNEYQALTDMLKYRNVKYETTRVDPSKYSTLEFTEVKSREEADELFKKLDEAEIVVKEEGESDE